MRTKRFYVFLMAVCFLFLFSFNPLVVAEDKLLGVKATEDNVVITKELEELFTSRVNSLQESEEELTIARVKLAHDFAQNEYLIVEFAPTGHLIYHPESRNVIAYTVQSLSPFHEYWDKEIYYGGLGGYYYKEGGVIYSIVSGEEVKIDAETVQNVREQATILKENKNIVAERRLKGVKTQVALAATDNNLTRAYYFEKLKSFGTNADATCGYLAAAIVLSYYANFYNVNFVNAAYITPASGTSTNYSTWEEMPALSNSLHLELVNLGHSMGYGNSTHAGSIMPIIRQYLENHGMEETTVYSTTTLFCKNFIARCINNDKPCIVFGKFQPPNNGSKINHGAVCYGIRTNSDGSIEYRLHYGWEGHTSYYLSSYTLGSVTRVDGDKEAHVHCANFKVNGVYRCGCGQIA